MSNRRLLTSALVAAVTLAICVVLGGSWTERLSDHRGFHQVRVADAVAPAGSAAAYAGPRRAFLIVFDGLGFEEASGMASLARLGAAGQCRRTDVGPLSVSRPLYSVLSTGLEQDRTGSRNNESRAPLQAESLWQLARRAGRPVSGTSELPWWHQLFPGGFSRYETPPRAADYFVDPPAEGLVLLHPVYIDETGHDHGAASPAYAAAVRRADAEFGRLLGGLDLSRDLVVATADHGHSLRGGHGGRQDRVAHVLTCFAGPGVRRLAPAGALRSTSVAPALALLLGLPFPAHMRAGDDELDVLWQIADPAQIPAAYLRDRQAALARFRAENAAALRRWLPDSGGSWDAFYAAARAAQARRAVPVAAALVLVLLAFTAACRRDGGLAFALAWMTATTALAVAGYVLLRGSFDPTSINARAPFIRVTAALSLAVGLAAGAAHLALRRHPAALLRDGAAYLALGAVLSVGHPVVFGYHLGFPVPPPLGIFFPYFAAVYLAPLSVLLLALGAALALRPPAARGPHL